MKCSVLLFCPEEKLKSHLLVLTAGTSALAHMTGPRSPLFIFFKTGIVFWYTLKSSSFSLNKTTYNKIINFPVLLI